VVLVVIARDAKPGDWVVYVPNHAEDDVLHKDCERGTVTSINTRTETVFVRYGNDVGAKRTNSENLVTARTYFEALLCRKEVQS